MTPPLPHGWKTVTFHGVGIDLPGDWTVEPWRPNCGVNGVSTPTVFIGPEGISGLFCPEFVAGGAEVILGFRIVAQRASVTETLNGLRASVSRYEAVYHGRLSGTITSIFVSLPSQGYSVTVICGESENFPGGAPGRAQRIAHTIHVASVTVSS